MQNKKIKAIISTDSSQELETKKEILIEKEKIESTCNIKIDCGNIILPELVTIKSSLENYKW